MAKNLQNEQIEEYGKRRRQRRVLKRVLIGASLCVAFLAVYALVLPASTLEHPEPACGLEEHEHTEACFETQLVCQLPETGAHVHTQACYDAEDVTKLICEKPATGHLHTQKCFATGDELVCENTEADHEHGDGCYLEEGTLVCEEEETVHVHTDACYELVEPEAADGQEAVEGDSAQAAEDAEGAEAQADAESAEAQPDSDSALDADIEASDPVDQKPEYRLTCDKEADGHVHFSQCYDDEGNLTCTEEEAVEVAHEHEDACSEEVAVCGLEAHNHDEVCYDPETLQMIQATKENKEAQEAEEAAKAEEAEATPEPVSDDELEALKVKGLAWENENMVVTFTLPEDTKEEVRFQVTEQPVAESDLSEEVKADENAWQNNLHIEATKAGEVVEDISELNANVQIQVKSEAVEPILEEINFAEVAIELEDEFGAQINVSSLGARSENQKLDVGSESQQLELIAHDVEDASMQFSLLNESYSVGANMPANPIFTVSYSSKVMKLETTDDSENQFVVFDTSSPDGSMNPKLPTNQDYSSKKYLKLRKLSSEEIPENDTEKIYKVSEAETAEPVKIYVDRTFEYIKSPGMKYINVLSDSTGYVLSKVTIKHPDNSIQEFSGSSIDDIHFTNREETKRKNPEYVLIEPEGVHIDFLYARKSAQPFSANALMHDYDVSDGTLYKDAEKNPGGAAGNYFIFTEKQGINSGSNYVDEGKNDLAHYAFGNSEWSVKTGWGNQALNGVAINKATGRADAWNCSFGLVKKNELIDGLPVFSDGLVAPALFGATKATGKTTYDNWYQLEYSRTGDTYEISAVKKKKQNTATSYDEVVLSDLDKFKSREGYSIKILYSNEFWALDGADSHGAEGHDPLFGQAAGSGNRRSFSVDPNNLDRGVVSLPVADFQPGEDIKQALSPNHNAYFGMESMVEFTLDPSYCGPLEYCFFGDDDMWVYLVEVEGETEKNPKLICDIGGVHASAGEYVNLWNYLEKPTQYNPNAVSKKYRLKFFYTERGASGSTCYMRFTLPSVTGADVQQNADLMVEKNVVGNASGLTNEYVFKLELFDKDGVNSLKDDYHYVKYNADGSAVPARTDSSGNVVYDDVIMWDQAEFTLRNGQYIIISDLPVGSTYAITELTAEGYEVKAEGDDIEVEYVDVWIDDQGKQHIEQCTAHNENSKGVHTARVSAQMKQASAIDNSSVQFAKFVNNVQYELPSTGGYGNRLFLVAGAVLLLAGFAVYRRNGKGALLRKTTCSSHPFSEESESRHSRRPNLVRRGARTRQEGRNHYW